MATAFHRNTMTQNEGGTIDEEYRNAAVIDRVNTTMAVWMGTSFACAQCHTHKYDPITQHEYFQVYALLNQTADADRKDEAPLLEFFDSDKLRLRNQLQTEIADLDKKFAAAAAGTLPGFDAWDRDISAPIPWSPLHPAKATSAAKAALEIGGDGIVKAAKPPAATDTYTVELPVAPGRIEAVRLEALADASLEGKGPGHSGGNFVISKVSAEIVPASPRLVSARHLRIEKVSAKYDHLALAEVEVFSGAQNIARKGQAKQISTSPDGPGAERAIDGKTDGDAEKGKSVAVTGGGAEPQWWELDLGSEQTIDRIVIWRRTDKGPGVAIDGLKLTLLDGQMKPTWETEEKRTFANREEITVSGRKELAMSTAFSDAVQAGFDPRDVLAEKSSPEKGWAIGGFTGADRTLTLIPKAGVVVSEPATLIITLVQNSKWAAHTLGAFRLSTTADPRTAKLAPLPPAILAASLAPAAARTGEQTQALRSYYARNISMELQPEQKRFATATKRLADLKPDTLPIMRELAGKDRRVTKVQLRGNWQDLGDEVQPDTPAAFQTLGDQPRNRLGLARWLVNRNNPLTARVTMNRLWEQVFGIGIVRTSEEFGSQGEQPSHPELLDWLAVEFMDSGWNVKHMLKLMVTSSSYRQISRTTPELQERDPENRLLARGPRFRPTGELLRDQALAVSGLLSRKMFGPGVRPLAPTLGLSTAFGRGNDWVTSEGEDRHRRSVYTEVRRNNPYASFTTFDAPNREVCTIRRSRTNTPLQAFVTLNDPVFIEAAQALARRISIAGKTPGDIIRHGFRLCTARHPTDAECARLLRLQEEALAFYQQDAKKAVEMATNSLGPIPPGANAAELAAWTTVANVLLNLDETLMKR